MLLFAARVLFGSCVFGACLAFVERIGLVSIPIISDPPAAPVVPGFRLRLYLARLRSSGGELVPLI